jgi:hypothetical protein
MDEQSPEKLPFSKAIIMTLSSLLQEVTDPKQLVKVFNQYYTIMLQLGDMIKSSTVSTVKISKRKWRFCKHTNSEETIDVLNQCLSELQELLLRCEEMIQHSAEIKLKVLASCFSKIKCKQAILSELEGVCNVVRATL